MRMKSLVFLMMFAFVLPSFSAVDTNSGSGSLQKPEMVFQSWRVGRSPTGNIQNKEQLSFITSTEMVCWVKASVGYKGGNQPNNTAPIDPDTVSWEFIDRSTGMNLAEPPGSNWSGLHPSKLSGTTAFNVVAKLTLKSYDDTSVYPAITTSCSATDANRQSRSPRHRGGEKMKMTIQFTARTTQGNTVTTSLSLVQDVIDQMRQEYLDTTRKIPERSAFKDSDGDFQNFGKVFYDFGHYDKMLYENLRGKHGAWTTKINELYRVNKSQFTRSNLFVTSAYRNPHHNDHHARETTARATTDKHGLHQYGLALDIRGREFDVDSDSNYGDQDKMIRAAQAAGSTKQFKYSTGHVHADWRGAGWPPSNPIPPADEFSLPPQGTDQPVAVAPAPPASVTGDCGTHTISASQAANHASVNFACGSHTYYACQTPSTSEINRHSYQTLPCGSHSGYRCTATSSHTQTTTCPSDTNGQSCSYGSYYACSPHTHAYPEPPADPPPPPPTPTTVSCVRRACTIAVSTPGEHRVQCDAGHTYMSCNTGSYNLHRTRTCRRSACRQTWQRCTSGAPSCLAYSGGSCWAE